VDRGKRDFRLEADSPAQKTGYKDLPFGKMGIQEKSTMRSHE
jgi:hypothetical protein